MTNSIVAMVVKACGISVKEAEAIAEVENKEAESLYIDCAREEQRDAEEAARWAEWEAENEFFEKQLRDFFNEHIAGKSYDELDSETWSEYSDMYKDVHGIRPRWYIQSLYEAKMRAEAEEVREDLENDGWIMLTDKDGWYTYERQISQSMMSIWKWDNCGNTFEAMEARMMKEV